MTFGCFYLDLFIRGLSLYLRALPSYLRGKKHLTALPPGRRTQSKDDERGRGKSQATAVMWHLSRCVFLVLSFCRGSPDQMSHPWISNTNRQE